MGIGAGAKTWRAYLVGDQAFAQMIRFALVGVLTGTIDYGAYDLVLFGLGRHAVVLVANAVGFFLATVVGYAVNRRFTFRDHRPDRRFAAYLAVTLAGFLIESAVLLVVDGITRHAGVGGMLTKNLERAAASLPALVWSFTLYRTVVFVPDSPGESPGLRTYGARLLPKVSPLVARYALGGLILTALLLRLPFLLALPVSAGEWQAAHWADLAAHGGVGLAAWAAQPARVWDGLLFLVFQWTGATLVAPRVLAVLAGVSTVAATYGLGKATGSPRSGLLAAALVAVNGPAILISHDGTSAALIPLLLTLAVWALVQERKTRRSFVVFVGGALVLASFIGGSAWVAGVIPGWVVAAWDVWPRKSARARTRHPKVVWLAGGLLFVWAAVLFTPIGQALGVPQAPAVSHLLSRSTAYLAAIVWSAGDIALLPRTLVPPVGAAVLLAVAGSVAYGLGYRKGRRVALPVLSASLIGPFVALAPSLRSLGGGGEALLPLIAVLAASAVRWASRRMRETRPGAVYPVAAALTAAIVAFGPLLGLGAYDGRVYRAARQDPPSPAVLVALRKAGAMPGTRVLLDSRGYRANVLGWVLALSGYRVQFVGNPYADPLGRFFPGPRWVPVFADPPEPVAFVITSQDHDALRESGIAVPVTARVGDPAHRAYLIGWINPVPGPAVPRVGQPVPWPSSGSGSHLPLSPLAVLSGGASGG